MADALPGILSPKNDFVFKRIFGDANHPAPLSAFLRAALGLPEDELAGISVVDPNLNPKHRDDKHSILDVHLTTRSGKEIDIEIQLEHTRELCDRIQYYTARMVAEKVASGEDYQDMPQSISIVIMNFREWKDKRYHHRFCLYDPEAKLPYPNSLAIHTLELPKRPAKSDGTGLWDWLTFLSSQTRKEFDSLARKGNAMAEAVGRLKELSADERERLLAINREKWLWDQAALRREGVREGETKGMKRGLQKGLQKGAVNKQIEIAARMLKAKMPLPEIAELTGLPMAKIKRLTVKEKA